MRFLLLLLALDACTPVRRRARGDLVHDIAFTGNGGPLSGQTDYQLRAQMAQREVGFGLLTWPGVYTVDPIVLDHAQLGRDAYRLEVWYAHHGWFDARFQGWEVRRIRAETERRAAVVDVRGVVAPGPRSVVRTLRIEGLPPALQAIGNAALRKAPIREGDPYDLELVEETRQTLAVMLVDHSHPYAVVQVSAEAHPEERAVDVVLVALPGIVGRFGAIELDGNEKVRDQLVEEAVQIEPGEAYSLEALQEAQRRLFGLGTFSLATVSPDLSDPTREEVPVRVSLTEARFRTFRIGGGFDYDGYVPVVRASTKLAHVNLLHELIRAELSANVGFAFDLAAEGSAIGGRLPTWGVDLTTTYPRLFSPKTALSLTADIEQDVFVGLWAYRRPRVDLAVSHRFSDVVQIKVGPHYEDYVFLDEYGQRIQQAQRQLFGLEGGEGFRYVLSALDEGLTVDWRDDPLRPTRGTYWTLVGRQAVPISELGFGFVRASAEARGYTRLRAPDRSAVFPLVLASRVGLTAMAPYGPSDSVPLPERAFLGGANSLRGFRSKQVGPYTTFCSYHDVAVRTGFLGLGGQQGNRTEEQLVRYDIPTGGTAAGELGAEVRYDWIYGVELAAFADGGLLAPSGEGLAADQLRGSVGVGARYVTPVGPVRFDLSLRPQYPEDLGPDEFVACQPADATPRVYDLLGLFPGLRDERHPPFAIVFFLTIGQPY